MRLAKLLHAGLRLARPTRARLLLGAGVFTASTLYLTRRVKTEELRDVELCDSADIAEGQMREFVVGPDKEKDKVLLARVDGRVHCVSAFCTHFGAQLSKGVLFGDRVWCPWHLACFSVVDGLNELGPTYKPLNVHPVAERDGKVVARLGPLHQPPKEPKHKRRDPKNSDHYLILGGGPAALSAAEVLRESGFTGRVTIASKEEHLPYDRTLLSKNPKADVKNLIFKTEAFFADRDIDFLPRKEAAKVDLANKQVHFTDHSALDFTKVLVATGGTPRNPFGDGVLTLRQYSDLDRIRARLPGAKSVVLIGGAFVGAETASMLKMDNKDLQVHLVSPHALYSDKVGPKAAELMERLAREKGVVLHKDVRVQSVTDGKKVALSSGETLAADLVVAGVGIVPNTHIVDASLLGSTGGIRVDDHLSAADGVLFAAGDVAEIAGARVEHISEAVAQGMVAGWNMHGKRKKHTLVPFYWTRAFNQGVQVSGLVPDRVDATVLVGDVAKNEFVEFLCAKGDCPALSGVNASDKVITFAQAKRLGMKFSPEQAAQPEFFEKLKKDVLANSKLCNCMRQKNSE